MPAEVVINFTMADGVGDLQLWHERLSHTCPQFVRMTADRGLVKGMMLKSRTFDDCEACHMGKQRKKPLKKSLNRDASQKNEVIYADLLFPPQRCNGTRFVAVLVIMDGYSRHVTIYPVKTKEAPEINQLMKRYINWAERQFGPDYPVRRVITDGGGEFNNEAITNWYAKKGIMYVINPPHSSQLNLCERTHQTLTGMAKAMMNASGFPKSFWIDALEMAVYVKNRVYSSATGRTPYEMLWGKRPDVHHITKFGALAYAHTRVSPQRKKFDVNCRVGFVLGLRENVAGCKIYFPSERTAQFVGDVRVNERVVYKDRHAPEFDEAVEAWASDGCDSEIAGGSGEAVMTDEADTEFSGEAEMQNGSDIESATDEEMEDNACESDIDSASDAVERVHPANRDASGEIVPDEEKHSILAQHDDEDESESQASVDDDYSDADNDSLDDTTAEQDEDEAVHSDSKDSVTIDGGLDGVESQDDAPGLDFAEQNDQKELEDEGDETYGDDNVYYGDVIRDESGGRDAAPAEDESSSSMVLDQAGQAAAEHGAEHVGQRRPREEADSDDEQPRKRKYWLREACDRRQPARYDSSEFEIYSTIIDDGNEILWHESEVRLPRSYKQAMQSPQAADWKAGMERELAEMEQKEVLELVREDEIPTGKKLLRTMWRFQIKTDHLGNVMRFRPRLVGREDQQEPGIDFDETFSPVARLASFRLLIALCILLGLVPYQCDINTAYLNAALKIVQFVKCIPGFPCKRGYCYRVNHALYGLHQSGREWNDEINEWLMTHGFERCTTEPCLYWYKKGDVIALLLIYVDDIICATNSESFKTELFHDMDVKYGIKDLGLLHEYLGVQVQQTDKGILIHQRKYSTKVIARFGLANAHGSKLPMETNVRFQNAGQSEKEDPSFSYRAAIGALMYLATGTRPDIAYAVGCLSRFVEAPTSKHYGAVRRLLRYLVDTRDDGILYSRNESVNEGRQEVASRELSVKGFSDSDWANCPETRKSVTGYVFMLAGGAIAWAARRQTVVAQSTAEAEYVSSCEACMEGRALMNVIWEVFPELRSELSLGVDNAAAISLATNPNYSRKTRHIELRWHYVRDQVSKAVVQIHKVESTDNPADLFTKALPLKPLMKFKSMIGMAKAAND